MVTVAQKPRQKPFFGRVTVRISEDVYQEAYEAAHEGRTTITAVIDDALRSFFNLVPVADSGPQPTPESTGN
jgi:hypothetical protein